MKSARTALEHKPGAWLVILLATALSMVFTACGGGPNSSASSTRQAEGLTITSVVPDSGPVTGGTGVTIRGSGFESGASVKFGDKTAASVKVVSSSRIQAVTPGSTAGVVSITVTNRSSESAALPEAFAFFHTVTLSWTASTSQVAGYNVYRSSTSDGPYARLNNGLIDGTTFTDNNVQPGQTYFYVATAVGDGRESGDSNQVEVTVPSP